MLILNIGDVVHRYRNAGFGNNYILFHPGEPKEVSVPIGLKLLEAHPTRFQMVPDESDTEPEKPDKTHPFMVLDEAVLGDTGVAQEDVQPAQAETVSQDPEEPSKARRGRPPKNEQEF